MHYRTKAKTVVELDERNRMLRHSQVVMVGPFTVLATQLEGCRRYALIVGGRELAVWASVPSLSDCNAVVLGAMRKSDLEMREAVDLLLRVPAKQPLVVA